MKEEIMTEWNPWWSGDLHLEYQPRDTTKTIEDWIERKEICWQENWKNHFDVHHNRKSSREYKQ
ncbi:MAG: hypothetical protein R6U17_06630 [Thermoplasmata archaeon]